MADGAATNNNNVATGDSLTAGLSDGMASAMYPTGASGATNTIISGGLMRNILPNKPQTYSNYSELLNQLYNLQGFYATPVTILDNDYSYLDSVRNPDASSNKSVYTWDSNGNAKSQYKALASMINDTDASNTIEIIKR